MEREAVGTLHVLEKFHHDCFAREESIITDQTRPIHARLVVMTKSWRTMKSKISGRKINTDAVGTTKHISECLSVQDIQQAILQVEFLQQLKDYIIQLPLSRKEIPQDIKPYWTFKDDLVVLYGILMKGRHIRIWEELQQPHRYRKYSAPGLKSNY